jgi:hypothetical protein
MCVVNVVGTVGIGRSALALYEHRCSVGGVAQANMPLTEGSALGRRLRRPL